MDVVVNPPRGDEESAASFAEQKSAVLALLAERAKLVADTLNGIEGFSCNTVQGAMYAFPRVSNSQLHGFYLKCISFFLIPYQERSTLCYCHDLITRA